MRIRDRIKSFERVPASAIRPNPKNWRTHPKNQRDALKGMLAEVGIAGAVIAYDPGDGGGLMLIDGHLRTEEIKGEVPVLILDVTPEEADKLLATIDPLSALAGQDDAALVELLRQVDSDSAAVQQMLADLVDLDALESGTGAQGDADEIPESAPARVALGDVWQLGRHLVACGDAGDPATWARLERTVGSFDAAIYDPPWDAEVALDTSALPPNVLAFADGFRAGDVVRLFGAPTWVFAWDCVSSWYTPNRPLRRMKLALWYGDVTAYDFDGAHYGEPGEAKEVQNTRGTYDYVPDARGKHLSDVFVRPITAEHADKVHKHAKPVDWMRMLIGNCTSGDLVDPFLGGGSSLIAAEQLGRTLVGVELEPTNCDAVIDRWEKLTGEKAVRL